MDPVEDEVCDEGIDWASEPRKTALQQAWEAKKQKTPRLGLDFGNVIVASEDCNLLRKSEDGTRIEFCEQPCAGAREGVRALVRLFRPENVFIVSKAGRRIAKLSDEWLRISKFAEDTGLLTDEAHLYFVHGRSEKRPIVETLGITHFVDDRMSVLRCLPSCTMRVLLCAPWVDHDDRYDRRDARVMQGRVMVQNWPEVVGVVRKWFKTRNKEYDGTGTPGPGTGLAISTSASSLFDPATGVTSPAASSPSPTTLMSSFLMQPAQAVPPSDASYTVAPHAAWNEAERHRQLENEHEQLRLAYLHLMQNLARAEADVTRVDALLRASDEENMMILARLDMLGQHLRQQEPPTAVTPLHTEAGGAPGSLAVQPAAPQLGSLLAMLPEASLPAPSTPACSTPTAKRAPACAPPSYAAPVSSIQSGKEVVPPRTNADSDLLGVLPCIPLGAVPGTPVGPAPGLPPPGFSPGPSPTMAPLGSPGLLPVRLELKASEDELALLPSELRADWNGSEPAQHNGISCASSLPASSPSAPR